MKSWKEFPRFGVVGVIGFTVDASTLAIILMAGGGVLWGRAISYVAAASCTWALNRRWTFHDRSTRRARQWAQFLAVNSFGGAVNKLWHLHRSCRSFKRFFYDFARYRCSNRFDLWSHHQLLSFKTHNLPEGWSFASAFFPLARSIPLAIEISRVLTRSSPSAAPAATVQREPRFTNQKFLPLPDQGVTVAARYDRNSP